MNGLAVYNGKKSDLRPKMVEVVLGMAGVAEFRGLVSQARFPVRQMTFRRSRVPKLGNHFLTSVTSDQLQVELVDFNEPFLIDYPNGIMDHPKCIVNRVGGIIPNSREEALLYQELNEESSQLQYTTNSWIMYLPSVQALLTRVRIVMCDSGLFAPNLENFTRLLGEEKPLAWESVIHTYRPYRLTFSCRIK